MRRRLIVQCLVALTFAACEGGSGGDPLAFCGNGEIDFDELCDDANDVDGDGCSSICRTEQCGNATVDTAAGEQCDDGNPIAGDGCSPNCRVEQCGNLIRDVDEVCDDGNTNDGDGCSATCLSDETCGNGILDTAVGEECDDANTTMCQDCRLPPDP